MALSITAHLYARRLAWAGTATFTLQEPRPVRLPKRRRPAHHVAAGARMAMIARTASARRCSHS